MRTDRAGWTVRSFLLVNFFLLLSSCRCTANSQTSERPLPRLFWGKYQGTTRRDLMFDRMLNIRPDFNAYNEVVCANDGSKVTVDYWPQKLDNFDANNNKTWKQHYQVQEKYFNSSANPQIIFVQIGGEGPINNKWVCYDNYTYMIAAKNYSALVIQVEHRFFGSNIGTDDLSTENLKYLTTEQALADLNVFITGYIKSRHFANPKVVAFGGSYPGTMAALLRVVYPKLTQGNIASSAPLYPKVDFWEYALVMEKTIRATGEDCYNATHDAFAELVSKTLYEEGRTELSKVFNLKPAFTKQPKKEDIDTVTSTIFSAFQGVIQYTFDGASDKFENKTGPRQNIAYACKLMTDPSVTSLLDRMSNVYKLAYGNVSIASSYDDFIAPFLNTSIKGDAADMRGWMYLSCNEFGWLQSTSNNGLFGDVVPISLYIKQCGDLFSNTFNATKIDQQIQGTLRKYGYPSDFNATNVFLPNGAFDPWSALGVTVENSSNSNHVVSHLTPGAAHCSDMYGAYDGEPVGLVETRKIFYEELAYYLSLDSTFKQPNGSEATVVSILGLVFTLFSLFLFH